MKSSDRAIYAGSFDPITLGHLDVIERAAPMFEELVVAVAHNSAKRSVFSVDERIEMIRESVSHLPNARVDAFDGLLVEYARKIGAGVLVRGLRSVKDFDYEFQMALTNRHLSTEIESIFLMTHGKYAHVASSLIREIAAMGGDVTGMVPDSVVWRLRQRLSGQRG